MDDRFDEWEHVDLVGIVTMNLDFEEFDPVGEFKVSVNSFEELNHCLMPDEEGMREEESLSEGSEGGVNLAEQSKSVRSSEIFVIRVGEGKGDGENLLDQVER